MFSLLIVICSTTTVDCKSLSPEDLFPTEDACKSRLYSVAAKVDKEPNFTLVGATCYNWGKPT